jgi:hypothetical protein
MDCERKKIVVDEINYLGVTFESSGGWKDKSSRK